MNIRTPTPRYIKPATQCEAPDLLVRWCAAKGIEYVGGTDAPLVFYSGFTRDFMVGVPTLVLSSSSSIDEN